MPICKNCKFCELNLASENRFFPEPDCHHPNNTKIEEIEDFVTGNYTREKYRKCSDMNKKGKCQFFEEIEKQSPRKKFLGIF